MPEAHLVLSLPQGAITATSLGLEGLAWHRSPGSGKHFQGRKLFIELALTDGQPAFEYLEEGGWRDAAGDTIRALASVAAGKRTKTALSNNAFSCTPIEAYRSVYLVKTGGEILALEPAGSLHDFRAGVCREEMSPSEVALAAGVAEPRERRRRLYLVISPIQLLLVSNLTPVEYAWYATHRPGKMFRQVVFTELDSEQSQLAAQSRFTDARLELELQPEKKTKTIVSDDCMNEVPFQAWTGHDRAAGAENGLFVADQEHIGLWRFPEAIPLNWERAAG